MPKILNNLPIEDLTEENDYLGIIDKGQILKTFFESNKGQFDEIKMFALYGEWGSGKSTLMKYLQKELKPNFNTFFFEAWQFESDLNLSSSLLEFLIEETKDATEQAFEELAETAIKLFRGFSKAITIKTPLININGKEIVQSFEEENEKSFIQLKKEFKTEFLRWEDFVTKGKNPKINIVFIDDLDRCEPKNVLNLLSALKLFFTYGKKTIFFCGIDKKAVNEAVITKYNNAVKANEYLEKVFDISFSMPKYQDLIKLINQYFPKIPLDSQNKFLNEEIKNFFVSINFTNPRRLKKILNKFNLLEKLKIEFEKSNRNLDLTPNIKTDGNGNFFEIVICLYFLILHEFFPDLLIEFYSRERKKANYLKYNHDNDKLIADFQDDFLFKSFTEIQNSLKYQKTKKEQQVRYQLAKSFSPINPLHIETSSAFLKDSYFVQCFLVEQKRIDYYFTIYLINLVEIFKVSKNVSNYSFEKFKYLSSNLL